MIHSHSISDLESSESFSVVEPAGGDASRKARASCAYSAFRIPKSVLFGDATGNTARRIALLLLLSEDIVRSGAGSISTTQIRTIVVVQKTSVATEPLMQPDACTEWLHDQNGIRTSRLRPSWTQSLLLNTCLTKSPKKVPTTRPPRGAGAFLLPPDRSLLILPHYWEHDISKLPLSVIVSLCIVSVHMFDLSLRLCTISYLCGHIHTDF